jgi:hypothetical protein
VSLEVVIKSIKPVFYTIWAMVTVAIAFFFLVVDSAANLESVSHPWTNALMSGGYVLSVLSLVLNLRRFKVAAEQLNPQTPLPSFYRKVSPDVLFNLTKQEKVIANAIAPVFLNGCGILWVINSIIATIGFSASVLTQKTDYYLLLGSIALFLQLISFPFFNRLITAVKSSPDFHHFD